MLFVTGKVTFDTDVNQQEYERLLWAVEEGGGQGRGCCDRGAIKISFRDQWERLSFCLRHDLLLPKVHM